MGFPLQQWAQATGPRREVGNRLPLNIYGLRGPRGRGGTPLALLGSALRGGASSRGGRKESRSQPLGVSAQGEQWTGIGLLHAPLWTPQFPSLCDGASGTHVALRASVRHKDKRVSWQMVEALQALALPEWLLQQETYLPHDLAEGPHSGFCVPSCHLHSTSSLCTCR